MGLTIYIHEAQPSLGAVFLCKEIPHYHFDGIFSIIFVITTLSRNRRMSNSNKITTKQNTEVGENQDFNLFVSEIKQKISNAQYEALKAVNQELINLYWEIGKNIVQRQQQFGWGKSVVKNLADELQNEFVGIRGFSVQNLWNMRQFYLEYQQNKKLQPLVREISWTKNLSIFQKCKDDLQREFYIKMVIKFGWTKNVLINQIENQSYEKFLLNQTNFDKTVPKAYQQQAKLAVKDEYNFDFLGLSEQHSEKELEAGLINQVRAFLIQMGSDFTFVGNQYRLEVDEEEYFIDLLLYHRRLQSLIAVELKVGKFKPEYTGKMNFYLSVLNDTVKLPHENPAVGIIICKDKKRTTVEYALKDSNKPIGVASYTINKSLPSEYQDLLPTPEEISEKLDFLINSSEGN